MRCWDKESRRYYKIPKIHKIPQRKPFKNDSNENK